MHANNSSILNVSCADQFEHSHKFDLKLANTQAIIWDNKPHKIASCIIEHLMSVALSFAVNYVIA